jgi:beta-phosphoglucomutase-like phosphatase (HAD superfamily)
MVEAVLSDIDGTLVESNWLHAAAWRDAFAVIDIPSTSQTDRAGGPYIKPADTLIRLNGPQKLFY